MASLTTIRLLTSWLPIKIITEKFDVLRGRLLGNHNDFHFTGSIKLDLIIRGGVEDTRLEAKAKDTKKIRGQGQPFRGQTLSRPRTGMLEAKDQGHKRKCSPKKKKKGLPKNFQAISKKKKGLHKNFSSDLHKKTFSKKFFKRSAKF